MEHVSVLVLVPPHRTAAVTEQPVGLRYLAHRSIVVLAVGVSNQAASAACTPRTGERLPDGILRLHADVVPHLLAVSGHGRLAGNLWDHLLVLPRAQRLHLEGLKVGTEV